MSLATEPICVSVADGEADQQGVPAVIEKLNWSGLGISCLPCVHGSTPVTDSPHGSGEEMVCQTCRNLNLRNNLIETIFECNATHETSMVKNIALSAFVHLTFLDLTKNKIVSLDGIQKLNLLKSLRLAHNRIKSLSPIWETAADSTEEAEKKLVCSLEVLDVSYNALECIVSEEEIQRLAEHSRGGNAIPLRVLNADHNEVRDFFVPTCFSSLEVLNIRNNNIAEIGQQEEFIETEGSLLFPLQEEFPQLIFLDLYDNPLSPAALRCITRSVDSYNTASPACARPHSLTLKIPDPEPEEGEVEDPSEAVVVQEEEEEAVDDGAAVEEAEGSPEGVQPNSLLDSSKKVRILTPRTRTTVPRAGSRKKENSPPKNKCRLPTKTAEPSSTTTGLLGTTGKGSAGSKIDWKVRSSSKPKSASGNSTSGAVRNASPSERTNVNKDGVELVEENVYKVDVEKCFHYFSTFLKEFIFVNQPEKYEAIFNNFLDNSSLFLFTKLPKLPLTFNYDTLSVTKPPKVILYNINIVGESAFDRGGMHRLFLFHILRSIQLVKENIISRAMKKVESNNSANNNITVNLLSAMDNNANNNITFISPLCVYHIFSDDDTGNSKNNNTIWNYFSWRVEWELQVAKRKMKFIKNQYGVRQTDTPETAHNTVCGLVYKDLPNFWEFLYKKWYAKFNSSRWVKRSNTHHYKKYHSSAKLYNNNNSADTGHVCWSSSLLLKTIIEGNISNHTSTNNSANTAVSPPRSTRRVNQNNGSRNHDTVCEAAKSIILNAESYIETCERYIHHTEQPTNPSSTSAYSTYTTDEIAERREQFLKLVTEKRRK